MAIVRTATRRFVSRQSSVPGVRSLMAALLSVSVGMTLGQSVLSQGTATPAPSDAIAAPVTPSAGPAIPLSPFEDATFGFRSVIPSGWTDRGRGVHTRAGTTSDGSDTRRSLVCSEILSIEDEDPGGTGDHHAACPSQQGRDLERRA